MAPTPKASDAAPVESAPPVEVAPDAAPVEDAAPKTVADLLGGKSKPPRTPTYKLTGPRVALPTVGDIPVFVTRGVRTTGSDDTEYLVLVDRGRESGITIDAVAYAIAGGAFDRTLCESLLALPIK